ncbi:hypothetical protein [Propionivibrio soli]|uniref:hypothetical protein n=1 Tax=Propionivibrio soli TaxID=2976531 RepID=UPI0021E8CB99|nr:hypothetical protein [Propionivibrio soli]
MNRLVHVERRLALFTVALVAGLVVCLIALIVGQTAELRRNEQRIRAAVIAEALAASIGRALAYDIPFDRLSGVDSVFGTRMSEDGDIVRIVLTDASGKVVAERAVPEPSSVAPIAISATVRPTEGESSAVGTVTVYTEPTTVLEALAFPAALGIIIVVATLTIARRSVSYALKRGAEAREIALHAMQERIAAGDLTTVVNETSPRSFDLRASWLTARIRDLNERRLRLQRLVASLLHTEPELGERQRLSALLIDAVADTRFAAIKPARDRVHPLRSDLGWILFLGSTAVWTALGASGAINGIPVWHRPLLLACAVAGCASGLPLGRRLAMGAPPKLAASLGLTITMLAPVLFAMAQGVDAFREPGLWVAIIALGVGFGIFVRALAALPFARQEPSPLTIAQGATTTISPSLMMRGLCVGWPLGMIGGTVLGVGWSFVAAGLVAGVAHMFLASLRIEQTRIISTHSGSRPLSPAHPGGWPFLGFAFGLFMASSVTGVFPGLRVDTPVETVFALCGLVLGIALAFAAAGRLTEKVFVALAALACGMIAAGYFDAVPYPIWVHTIAVGVLGFAISGHLIIVGTREAAGLEVLPRAGTGCVLGCALSAVALYADLPMHWLWWAGCAAWIGLAWVCFAAKEQR